MKAAGYVLGLTLAFAGGAALVCGAGLGSLALTAVGLLIAGVVGEPEGGE